MDVKSGNNAQMTTGSGAEFKRILFIIYKFILVYDDKRNRK